MARVSFSRFTWQVRSFTKSTRKRANSRRTGEFGFGEFIFGEVGLGGGGRARAGLGHSEWAKRSPITFLTFAFSSGVLMKIVCPQSGHGKETAYLDRASL
jgi:hypothetical protein